MTMRIAMSAVLAAGMLVAATVAARAETVFVPNNAPWAFQQGDKTVGILVTVTQELGKRAGLDLAARDVPVARMIDSINTKQGDFAMIGALTKIDADQVGEVFSIPIVALARKGVPLKSYDDLKPLNTAFVKGTNFGSDYDKDASLKKSEEPNFEQLLKKMQAGRIDVGVGSAPGLRFSAKVFDVSDTLGDSLKLTDTPLALFVARDKLPAETVTKVKTALAAMRSDGTIDGIIGQYVTKDWAPK
ncbi:substrate-binding periplasmic protein [Elstera cyanobacteriorum]|uniref:Solute-binding protein family 3/N-terminal domain-containing protein n=2 Tax=Elstera cyanobacteriorum TaxID=2022747 RepID=A0A255XJM5_9PROT|nr:transporter substrate-binding domain-containing protein [Elstera cyanobacteriorum]OYQ16594.1 hypothetical protein CHR90_16500 [Elstera cyanobacteriorum]